MPTALQASRDFAARAIARLRSGVEGVNRDVRRPGPDIHVDPFGPTNVSTPAALIKVATAIHAGQRARANYEQAQATADLAREKARAEIARIRAEEQYYLGQGRQTSQPRPEHALPPAPVTLPTDIGNIPANTPVDPRAVTAEGGRLAREAAANRAANRAKQVKSIAASRAALENIDKQAAREVQVRGDLEAATYWRRTGLLDRVRSTDKNVQEQALRAMGIDPDRFAAASITQQEETIAKARARIESRSRMNIQRNINEYYEPFRTKHRRVIEEASLGLVEPESIAQPPAPEPTPAADTVIQYDEQGNPIPAEP